MYRTILAAPPLIAAAGVKVASDSGEVKPSTNICKPSELPLYRQDIKIETHHRKLDDNSDSYLREGIRTVRIEVQKVTNLLSTQKNQVVGVLHDGKEKTQFIIDYLNQEDNTIPRYGAIVIGGLSGYIFGLRGGFIRRSFYATIGATIIASICYPSQAVMYAQHGLVEAKQFAKIGYNFAYGIKPGDDVNAPNWPKVPTTFSELGQSLSGLAKSAKDAVFSDKKD